MKYLIFIISSLVIMGCSKDGSGSSQLDLRQTCEHDSVFAGEWRDQSLNDLVLNDDCTGYEKVCDASFTYYKPTGGQVLIDVASKNGNPSCPPLGESTCNISHGVDESSEFLVLNCGGGDTFYFPKTL